MFTVGDNVKFKSGDYAPLDFNDYTNAIEAEKYGLDINAIYTIERTVEEAHMVTIKGLSFFSDRFEIAAEPASMPQPSTPQIGDIWCNENKTEVVKVVSRYKTIYNVEKIGHTILKSKLLTHGSVYSDVLTAFVDAYPVLRHREPPKPQKQKDLKQTTQQSKPPAQSTKDQWCNIGYAFASGYFAKSSNNIAYYWRGNKIKAVYEGLEAVATCNKKEEFSDVKGRRIAGNRVMSLWFAKAAKEAAEEE